MRDAALVLAEQQRYWVALLNLQRTWLTDDSAISFIPPRHRDFESMPDWPKAKALTYLLNNLEILRESHRRLEAGQAPDYALLNHSLGSLTLRLQRWEGLEALREAHRSKTELGGRVETLQVTSDLSRVNPGTRYIRATVERSLYYFALYVDDRLSDPAYPGVSPGRWRVAARDDPTGDLALVVAQPARRTP